MYRAGSLRCAFLAIVASAILALGAPAVTAPAAPDGIASHTCSAPDEDLRLKK